MFNGFGDKTFEFFMAIRFNNNREFFHNNHDWYMDYVRKPLLELAFELSDTIEMLDDTLERRPEKVLSRINRDLRFSKDKSPYRDWLWLAYRCDGEDKHRYPGFYVDISDGGMGMGLGFYEDNKPLTDALRTIIANDPSGVRAALDAADSSFTLNARTYKKLTVPQNATEYGLQDWYKMKSFYVSATINDFELMRSSALIDFIKRGLLSLKPIYEVFKKAEAGMSRTALNGES